MRHLTLSLALPHAVMAALSVRQSVEPVVREATLVGLLGDPELNRDSCGSSIFGERALWVCRDTQPYDANGIPILPIVTTSASWTDLVPGGGTELLQYGDNRGLSFYPLLEGNCNDNQAGVCDDGTRFVVWPDNPPLVTETGGGSTVGYTWSINYHIRGLENLIQDPSTALYRVTYVDGNEELPSVELVDRAFWAENQIPFGNYGGVVRDGTAYLYGKGSDGQVSLARVPADSVTDKSTYEYWVSGGWTRDVPSLGDSAAHIPFASAGGQGTYYYSELWQSYVWIGQPGLSVSADFHITTAPAPEGPWIQPFLFHQAENGNFELGAYTLQAHPGLTPSDSNIIYITYTKTDVVGDNVALYTHPLIRIEWEA